MKRKAVACILTASFAFAFVAPSFMPAGDQYKGNPKGSTYVSKPLKKGMFKPL